MRSKHIFIIELESRDEMARFLLSRFSDFTVILRIYKRNSQSFYDDKSLKGMPKIGQLDSNI